MKKVIIALVTVVFIFSCNNSTEQADNVIEKPELIFPVTIDIDGAMNNQDTMLLSDFTDEIYYVKIKPPTGLFLKIIRDVQIVNDTIYVFEGTINKIIAFDMDGNYIKTIGKIGRGPNEYISLRSFYVDESNSYLLFYTSSGDILRYSPDGELIKKYFNLKYANEMYFLNQKLIFTGFMGSNKNMPDSIMKITVTEFNGTKIDSIPSPFYSINNWRVKNLWFPGHYAASRFNGVLLSYEPCADTILQISERGEISPRYIFDTGGNCFPFESRYMNNDEEIKRKRNDIINVTSSPFETENNLFFKFAFKREAFIYRLDKTTLRGSTFYYYGNAQIDMSIGDTGYPDDFGLVNNIDGGLDFFPQWSVYNNSTQYFVSAKDAYEMKQILTPEYFANREAIAPEKKAALIELVNNIEEKDDFVLMIVKLK
jgi:hypothetical protein